jgi:hypothetical protein
MLSTHERNASDPTPPKDGHPNRAGKIDKTLFAAQLQALGALQPQH